MKSVLYLFLFLFVFVSCKNDKENNTAIRKTTHPPIVFDGIDSSIKPGDDFFNHVNKTWFSNAVIDDDEVGVGAYRFLNIPQQKLLLNILTEVSQTTATKGSVEQMVGDFFASGMDTISINKRGAKPIKPILEKIDAINNTSELMHFVASQIPNGDYSIISARISADQENSTNTILHLMQTGLGLPDRDYYFKKEASVIKIQEAYKIYLTTLFNLVGENNAIKKATIVYDIEKRFAESHKTRIERRDVKANYNKVAVSDLAAKHKNLHWRKTLQILGADVDSLNIAQPEYYNVLNSLLEKISLENWKIYLKANSIIAHDNILSQSFQNAAFEYSKVLSGQTVQQSRAKKMVRRVDNQLGFSLGQLYVKRYFNEASKQRVLDLVNNFQKALEKRINKLDWMSDSTKVKAKEKLYAINKKIGYPDVWRQYDVTIDRNRFFENVVALRKDAYQYKLKQLNKPPNRDRWSTTPSTVTAYYNPSLNEIVFPAGILQPPYFDLHADDAVNYGGIGMVIGHEFTHAFDDQGAQYDKEGNVKNWWTKNDYKKFKAKTQQIVKQYDAFTVLDGVHLKGALTVGENTADNGGIAIAFDAFKMTEQGKNFTEIGGYTPNQRFFLSIARIWRVKMRDQFLRNYIANDPHSPPIWRVNGPLMNFTPFYDAFKVMPGEQNYRTEAERIKIW